MRQQLKAQEDRKLLQQRSSHSFEQRKKKEENIVHGAEGFLGAPLPENPPSLVQLARLCQHNCEFNIFSEILAHKKISSSRTDRKMPPNPHSITYISPNAPWPQA
jgi:hypothetical protein